jgi:hypothetical protein
LAGFYKAIHKISIGNIKMREYSRRNSMNQSREPGK